MTSFSNILFSFESGTWCLGFHSNSGCGEDRAIVNRSLVVFGVLYLLIIGELSVWLSLIHTFTLSFDLLGELPLLSGL